MNAILKNTAKEFEHQQELLHAVNDTAQVLLAAMDEDKFEASVLKGMEIIAHCLDVDRGYIWKNEMRGDVLYYAMIFEWQNDKGRRTNPVENKMVFPYTDVPSWEASFLKGECVNGPLDDLSQEEKDRLLNHGMKSVFAIPVYLKNIFWGYVSFDDCRQARCLTDDEVNILRSVSLMLANAINHNELTLNLRSAAMDLRSALENAQDASRAKSEFLATMSHEIRTPMNAIIGIAQIQLQKENLPLEYKEALEKIFSSGNSLLGIINDILDMSKIETGKMGINPAEYDVPSLINDAVQLNIVRIGHKPITFKLDLDENLPSKLFGDELRIKQVLNNLLSNAIKYTDKGLVKLSVNHLSQGDASTMRDIMLRFIVEDSGQGMRSEDIKRLFSEYMRFNANANRTTEGTGLGLNITKKLVEMMDGSIAVESEYGKGSIFTVTIKQKAPECPPIGAAAAQRLRDFTFTADRQAPIMQIVREPMPYGSVLVVDDVETNLYVAVGLLSSYQLKIETAASGFAAIERIKDGKTFDVIFMDHMMPEMDGIEATERLREMGYNGVIVALTANALIGNDEMFAQHGFDGFISKPIDIRSLNLLLNRFIRDRHPQEAAMSGSPQSASAELATAQAQTQVSAQVSVQVPGEINAKLLQIFCRDAEKAIGALRATAGGNIKLFTTTAHAMKSALANIGEDEKSLLAAALEKAGLDDDRDFISANTENFIKTLETLIRELSSALADADNSMDADSAAANSADGASVAEDTAYLKEQIQIVKKACEDYDDTAAYAALDRLKQKSWKPKTSAALEEIRDALFLHSDFDGAAGSAEKIAGGNF